MLVITGTDDFLRHMRETLRSITLYAIKNLLLEKHLIAPDTVQKKISLHFFIQYSNSLVHIIIPAVPRDFRAMNVTKNMFCITLLFFF